LTTFFRFARIGVAIGVLALANATFAQNVRNLSVFKASGSPTASEVTMPSNVDDILAVLDQYKLTTETQEKLRAEANAKPAVNASKHDLAVFYHRRGEMRGRLGLAQESIADLQLAEQNAAPEDGGVLGDISDVRTDLVFAEKAGGSMSIAVEMAKRIVRDNQGTSLRSMVYALTGHAALMNLFYEMSDLDGVRAMFREINGDMSVLRRKGALLWAPKVIATGVNLVDQASQALMLDADGKYREAERFYRVALDHAYDLVAQGRSNELAYRRGSKQASSRETDFARNLVLQGRLSEAEYYQRSALHRILSAYGRDSHHTTRVVTGLGIIVMDAGRFVDAEKLANAAIDGYVRAGGGGASLSLAQARGLLGDALLAQGRMVDASAAYGESAKGLELDTSLQGQFNGKRLGWGIALLKSGEQQRALHMIQGIYQKRLAQGHAPTEIITAQSRGVYAMALAANGQSEKALAEFRAAVPVLLEGSRRDSDGSALRHKQLVWVLEDYMKLLVDMKDSPALKATGIDAASEVFRIADVARGSAVQKALAESAARSIPSDPALAALTRKVQDTEHRYGALSEILNRLVSAPPEQQLPKVIADMKRDIEALREERSTLKAALEIRFPEYADLISPKPISLAQAQGALAADDALISIYVGADRSYVWALPKTGSAAFASVALSQADIAERVAQLRKALDIGSTQLENFPRFDLAKSYELYSKLLMPVEAGWKGAKNLIIVPHKALGQLPFSLLTTAPVELNAKDVKLFEGYRQVPWLIRQTAVTQLPAVSTLIALRRMPAAKPGRKEFIGFGDPYFSKEMELEATKLGSASLETTTRGFGRVRSRSIANVAGANSTVRNSAGLGQLSRLEDTADEIKSIATVLKANPATDIFLGKDASEKNALSGKLDNHRIVMFATHGLLPGDLNGQTQPALALSAPEVTGNAGENGLLTTDKVLGLKLNADWVVLSACNTASGDGAGSEAVSGLGRAFFFAGARTLLVSNWPVETVSAKLLTTKLFEHQVVNPKASRAEALRETMLDLIDNAEPGGFTYAHPMFWAPFSLVGDGGR
jgi:CHAT domain-containing protein